MKPVTINKGTKESFESFITNGGTTEAGLRMFYTSGELRGMLDLARSEILQHRGATSAPTACANDKGTMAKLEADFNACKAAKASAKPGAAMPTIACMSDKQQAARAAAKPATAPASAKAAAPAPVATITAAEYLASQTKATMPRAEFLKLDHRGRNAAMRSGIRLID
jgi:hypothetical protein